MAVQPSVATRGRPPGYTAARRPRRSLDEVFQKERHPRGLELKSQEIADLVAFLKTL